nr:integrase domain-containing protein [Pseudidiomarina salinarum]
MSTMAKVLCCALNPMAARLWIFNYQQPFTGKRKNLGLGQYPALSLADARKKRESFLSLLARDVDPKEDREKQQQERKAATENTFEAVAKRWFKVHQTKVKADTADKIWRSLENDVIPRIGKLPIASITAPKAIEVIQQVTGRESFETARKLARRMNNVMVFAVNAGIVHANPLSGIKEMIPSTRVQNRPALAPGELPELMRALNFANIKFQTRCLIEWQLHTMVRPGEAVTAKWSEIDYESRLWVIPAERMKMQREHQIPLTEQMLAILELMKQISSHREYIFPSMRQPLEPANKETANMALKRMGFKDRLVAHGMRALASTTLNEEGFSPDVIEAALAHVDHNKIRGAYNRSTYLEQRRKMMIWWSEHIESAANGNMSLANAQRGLRVVNV